MSEEKLKEDNINSLCKKYFTPELCDEPVTESTRTLEFKLYTQLKKYVIYLKKKYQNLTTEDFEDISIDVIIKCFDIWKRDKKDRSYSSYFAQSFKYAAVEFIRKKNNRQIKELSLDAPVKGLEGDDSRTLGEEICDDSSLIDSIIDRKNTPIRAKLYFEYIDKCFRLKTRSDWYKPLLTCRFYEDLHTIYDLPEFAYDLYKLSFIDRSVYSMEQQPTQKEIAARLGKNEGQMTKAFDNFVQQVSEMYDKSELKKKLE